MKYPDKESSILEFKQALPQNNQIAKTLIGFCNQHGGKIVVGVHDDGTIIGLSEDEIEYALEYLDQMVYKATCPPIIPKVYAQTISDKMVLIIEVASGMNKPYYLQKEGLEHGTYIRLGRSTLKATADIIEELKWEAHGLTFDTMPLYQAKMKDLNIAKIKTFFKTSKGSKKIPSDFELALIAYNLIVREHAHTYPTIAGILLFGNEPDAFFSEAYINCTRFAGNEGREALATLDCYGTLMEQFHEAYNFVLSKLHRSFTIKGPIRQEEFEIPEVAVREAIINALIHRNYNIKAPIKIAIYDNRIEIFSPGSFPGPLTSKNVMMGLTYLRNTAIAKVFREVGYIEKLGTGFLTIFNSYKQRELRTPEIIDGENFVKCILPRATENFPSLKIEGDELKKILELFHYATELSISDIMKSLGISRATAGRRLKELAKQESIKKIGSGTSSRYVLVK